MSEPLSEYDAYSEWDEWDEDDLAELDEFVKRLKESRKPTVHIINQKRYEEFQYSLDRISSIIRRESPDAKICYTLNDESNTGTAGIRIETDELIAHDVKEFIEAVKFATSLKMSPLPDCNLRIDIKFKDVLQEVKSEESKGEDR